MPPLLNEQQRQRAIQLMEAYLASRGIDGRPTLEEVRQRDERRAHVIQSQLRPLLDAYLSNDLPLGEFKSKIDGTNKREDHWGFKGIKGQMFFNMLVNVGDEDDVNAELRAVLPVPSDDDTARSRLRTFASFVKSVGELHVESGGTKHQRPKIGSVPFFVSYFWQVQDLKTWPVFYTATERAFSDLNLWQQPEDAGEAYVHFKQMQEELADVFSQAAERPFNLYDVEHVFYHHNGNPYEAAVTAQSSSNRVSLTSPAAEDSISVPPEPASTPIKAQQPLTSLPTSYVPPIVSVLPALAAHEAWTVPAAEASGMSVDRAFEKHVDAALSILGYDTKLLGQGQGRVPDGHAVAHEHSYGLLWDAKVRRGGYSMGTDDRTIRDYVDSHGRNLKGRRLRNLYYVLVSSTFPSDFETAVRMLKMETDVSEVIFLEASALVAMVDLKLRDPHGLSSGPDGLQRLFSNSGILTAADVRSALEN
jgi:hypothetical protein